MARQATLINLGTMLGIAIRRPTGRDAGNQQNDKDRHQFHQLGPPRRAPGVMRVATVSVPQDRKAVGTGFWPSDWRSTAQCIASSPRMEAATLASSRSTRMGTAPR